MSSLWGFKLRIAGRAGFVLAKGALTSKSSGEGDIRRALVEARLVECVVNLPAKLFLNTQIPASLWFLARERVAGRADEVLFIDARNLGHLINRRSRVFSAADVQQVAEVFHRWRDPSGGYEDVKGFCHSASVEQVRGLDYVLTPGRYVGLADEVDDFDFKERFSSLKAEFEAQLVEETRLNQAICDSLAKIVL